VHELVVAYLILLDGSDMSSIAHNRRHLCCLGTRGRADIEDILIVFWCECENREHRCNRLEVYIPVVECSSSLDSILMHSVEYINPIDSTELLRGDSLLIEFSKYLTPISFETIDTKRAFSRSGKYFYYFIVVVSEDGFQARLEFFWKGFCHIILLRNTYLHRHP
jgi:hypothetical protein